VNLKSIKKQCKNLVKSLYNHKYLAYALYNTIGVNAIDVPAMQMIDNMNAWNFYHSFGWIPYLTAFNLIRILPILYYAKKRNVREILNFSEIFLWTLPLEDGIHYILRGRNFISPFNNEYGIKPMHYPFPWGNEHVAQFYGRNFGLAAIFSLLKRKMLPKLEGYFFETKK
jgi:hypothetical protein